MNTGGYAGKTAWIDLTHKEVEITTTDSELMKLYMGGTGFGVKLLYDHIKPGTDPLGPENLLIFAAGPLTGSDSPSSSRMAVTARSPLTGAVGMATSGGHFPSEMKYAGFDIIAIKGAAKEPTYLLLDKGRVSFRSAKKLWGMNTFDCQEFIKEDLPGNGYRIACIGQAGEKISLIASIINERRAAGRKGLGAVMGAKKLKAVVVRGDRKVAIAEPERFQTALVELLRRYKAHPTLYSSFSKHGTSALVDSTSELGIFPTHNYSATGLYDYAEDTGYETQDKDIVRKNPCRRCPAACSQVRISQEGDYPGVLTEGPEFETAWAFGGNTGVSDVSAIYLADRLCDEYGLDTISVGSVIGFAMELYERGIITSKETDGLELNFGNHQAQIELIHKIAFRKEFGDILADGVVKASERIGRGSESYAMHVKGLELPAYDVRGAKTHGVNYSTAYTGGDHNRGYAFQEIFGIPVPIGYDRFSIDGAAELCMWNQIMEMALCDCPMICAFMISEGLLRDEEQGNTQELTERRIGTVSELVSAATGLAFTPAELILLGERVNTLARCFNLREGFTRADDYLPERLTVEPIPGGPSKGALTSLEEQDTMLDRYYAAFGYDHGGVPTKERLKKLSLDFVTEDLQKAGLNPR
jgi:aldehyde:ferredoxin oxidoreductase